ncbi:MAG: uroporphyrinogen decarboxylase family protein [Phycisphaerae bacterium]
MMTSRELALKAISHERPDTIPATLYVEEKIRNLYGKDFVNDTVRILWEIEQEKIDSHVFRDPFGVRWERNRASACFIDPPLKEPEAGQIPRIKLLPEGEERRIRDIRLANPDKFIYYQFTMTFGERLWALRGLEQYLADLIENPGFIHESLDILLAMHLEALQTLVLLPIDGITFGDDFGTQRGLMINPNSFRQYFRPRLAVLYEKVRAAGLVVGAHSCGDNTAIMRDYVQIGLQVFHPLQPECMDISAIKREYGKDLTFRGGIGVQGSVVYGTPDQVKRDVFHAVQILSRDGGYLMEPCKPLPPETPVENVRAFIEAMEQARRYDFGD